VRVLRAARAAGVQRVVLTSSFWAIGFGHAGPGPFDETVWTNLDAPVTPYVKAKTRAERAAWDYLAVEGGPMELVKRFIASGGYLSLAEMADMLRSGLGPAAAKVPARPIPTWLLKTIGRVVKPMREMSLMAGVVREPAPGKATRLLGWRPRPTDQTIIDTARSLRGYPEPASAARTRSA
jgi:nucleoside-diphosphate-sugar epimerase